MVLLGLMVVMASEDFVLIGLMVVMASEDGVAWFNGCHG